jgi:hypothetical protein
MRRPRCPTPARTEAASTPRRGRRCLAAAAAIAALGLTSCSTGDPTPRAAAGAAQTTAATAGWDTTNLPDPCRLLTAPEVAAEFRHPIGPVARIAEWPPFCQFVLDPGTHTVLDVSDDSRPDAKIGFEQHKNDGTPIQPISGLGDDAYWLPTTSSMHILSGPDHVYLALRSDTNPPASARAHATALARLALPRSGHRDKH